MSERVWFPSTNGPRLAGLIDHPEGTVRGWGASPKVETAWLSGRDLGRALAGRLS